jgi:hypothetical protein
MRRWPSIAGRLKRENLPSRPAIEGSCEQAFSGNDGARVSALTYRAGLVECFHFEVVQLPVK